METQSRIEYLVNLKCAAGFDANKTYPLLFQHLGYRKLIAEQLLMGAFSIEQKEQLEELYNHVNSDIKLILGI